jgi:hypothetical protein
MKKFLLTSALFIFVALKSFAQTTASTNGGGKFSIGIEAGVPVGDASDGFNAVIGGSVKYELPMAAKTYFTLSAGYSAFLTKGDLTAIGVPSSFGFVPLKAGIKYYSSDGFFLEGQAGIVFSTEEGGGSAFVYAPGIGYTFNGGFEMGVRYEGWPKDGGTTSQIGLRLAYRF